MKSAVSPTPGAVRKIRDGKSVLSKFPKFNFLEISSETKVKTTLPDHRSKETVIEHFVNPKMTPTTDMRKAGNNGEGTHLGQRN